MIKTLAIAICLTLLTACSSTSVLDNWPEAVPAQTYFLQTYEEDTENQALQSDEDYLRWVLRFYEGSMTMPMGWNDLTGVISDGLEADRRAAIEARRDRLGALIAAEWAKHNSVRDIDTGMLSLWGTVMQETADSGEADLRLNAIELITQDVEALLNASLSAEEISEARYESALGISLYEDDWF